jgi:hypothetical protein
MNEDVRYCPFCKCKTWHVNGVCEWADGHKLECKSLHGEIPRFAERQPVGTTVGI